MKRLLVNGYKDKITIVEQAGYHELSSLNSYEQIADVTDDFYRCVVSYCSEQVEFMIDGMKFKVTCERIE